MVNAHGGNVDALRIAARTASAEGRRLHAWWPTPMAGDDAHAGHTETSVMLALHPELVAAGRARPGDVRPITAIAGELRRRRRTCRQRERRARRPDGRERRGWGADPRPLDRSARDVGRRGARRLGRRPSVVIRRYVLDASTRQLGDDGTIVLGGSPLRLFRLTRVGAAAFASCRRGDPVAPSALIERLLDAGAIHPIVDGDEPHRFAVGRRHRGRAGAEPGLRSTRGHRALQRRRGRGRRGGRRLHPAGGRGAGSASAAARAQPGTGRRPHGRARRGADRAG